MDTTAYVALVKDAYLLEIGVLQEKISTLLLCM